ncbi:MAG: response regulator transcription factor, partial [Anaerococcus sp.]|nr:response regulator transcription factor [Anaerococcus sp.]
SLDISYFKNFNLIILDINLPNYSGYEILTSIKDKLTTPVLILTSRNTLEDELQSFDLGADEFLTKPVSVNRLIARSKKLLNIYENFSDEIRLNNIVLETSTNKLTYKNTFVILAQNEGELLASLMKAYPNAISKDELLKQTWNTEYIDENILHVNINRLRKKLKSLGLDNFIVNVRSVGYKINIEEV